MNTPGHGLPPYGATQPYPPPAHGHHPGGYGGGVERPATVWVGMVLLVLSAAPFLVLGVLSLVWSTLAVPVRELTGGLAGPELESAMRGALASGPRGAGSMPGDSGH